MSPPWKSELRLRIGRRHCEATLHAPWTRRAVAHARAAGTPETAMAAALQSLRAGGTPALPSTAAVSLADELVYLSLRPPRAAWPDALRDARSHFAQSLGRDDLVVQVAPMPQAASWLAAAVEPDRLALWRGLLAAEGITIARLGLQLVDDLQALDGVPTGRVVVALMRDEGVTLVRIADGVPVALAWERCDNDALRNVEQRLLAYQNDDETLAVACRTPDQHDAMQRFANAYHWTLLAPPASPA